MPANFAFMHRVSVLFGVASLVIFAGCRLPHETATLPFFPIGIYAVPSTNDFRIIKEAGFNLVAGRAERSYLDAADGAGLGVLASPYTSAGPDFNAAAARQAVKDWDRHPALWAWYLVDEPDLNVVPPAQVIEAQRCVKAAGARKPTALVLFQGYEALHFANLADITMIDRYPIPWLPLANFGQHVTLARLAVAKGRPLIAVIQAFDWSYVPELLPGEQNLRPPTGAELRCMTYEALARGANGLFYYAFDDGRWRMREHPETWAALQSVVREVNDRLPLFQAEPVWWPKRHAFGDRTRRFNAALESSITSCLLRVRAGNATIPAGDYVLAVNNTEWTQTYSFNLPPQNETMGEKRGKTDGEGRRERGEKWEGTSNTRASAFNTQPRQTGRLKETKAGILKAQSSEGEATERRPASEVQTGVPVLGEHRSLLPRDNRLTDEFGPYAVHVYGPLLHHAGEP